MSGAKTTAAEVPAPPNRRAAVVIGVGRSAGLTPLISAAPSAEAIGAWLAGLDPGYDVTVLTDAKEPVTRKQIFDAIRGYLIPTRYELLLVYYIGHGIFVNQTDVWMLSGLPEDPAECVNLKTSLDQAKFCGVRTVVFVSDACRTLPTTLGQARLTGTSVFPDLPQFTKRTGMVDHFCATAEGSPAFEGEIDGVRQSFLTHALRRAYQAPRANMRLKVTYDGRQIEVVPNRKLGTFLQDTIDETLGQVDFTKTQHIEANVPSADGVFIAPVDPNAPPAETVAPASPNEGHFGFDEDQSRETAGRPPETPAAVPAADDLTLIMGIDAQTAQTLETLGVRHFSEVAGWDDTDVAGLEPTVTDAVSRVESENWIGQARTLADLQKNLLALQAGNQQMVPGLDAGLAPRVARSVDIGPLVRRMRERMPDDNVTRFETATGLSLSGARIARQEISKVGRPGAMSEIAPEKSRGPDQSVVRIYPDGPFCQVAIELEDGRCLLVPGFNGYVGHIRIDAEGMASLSYVPADYTSRADEAAGRRAELDRLRAAATLALEQRRFSISDPWTADALASAIRMGKAIDPVLGLYAAYAYSESGNDTMIKSVSDLMRDDLGADLFDVRMLLHRHWPAQTELPVTPSCPLLTQGWSLLESRAAPLPPVLVSLRPKLLDALFTTFDAGSGDALFDAIQTGEL